MSDTPMPETLESLAAKIAQLSETVQAGFARVDARFGSVDAHLGSVDTRLGSLDARLDSVDARLDSVDGRLDSVDGRLDSVDGRLDSVGGRLDSVDGRLDSVDGRFGSIDGKLDEMRAQLGVKIEAVDTRVTQVYDAVIALTSHHKQNRKDHQRFDKKLKEHDVRLLALEHRAPRSRGRGR